jgi:lipopolysaccharide/colanic/teichoic acid biosynthesis glycosyltransferase
MGNGSAPHGVRDGYKSWFDITVLIAAHVLLLPLWLLLWIVIPILIRLGDGGPVFYTQDRVGKDGRIFTVFKFRTMILDAEAKGAAWTMDHDPRITRVGRVLRRTALDELPEVINIWKGDMSLVGPRALDVAEQRSLEGLIAGFEDRLQVRPGLTGLAQVYDARDDAREKYRYDLEYVQRMSPWLDMKLLILSVRNTLGVKWDRRSGKSSDANLISGSPTRNNREQELQGKVTSKPRTGSEPPRQDS